MGIKVIKRSRLWTPDDLEIKPILWVDADSCKIVEDNSGISAIYDKYNQVLRPLSGYTYHYWPFIQNGKRWLGTNPNDFTLPYRMGMGSLTSSGVFQGASGVSAIGTYYRHATTSSYQTFWSINNISDDGNTNASQAAQAMITLKQFNNATNIQWQARRVIGDTHLVQTVNVGASAGGITCSQRLDAKNAKHSFHIGNHWDNMESVAGVSTGELKGCSNSAYQIMVGFQRDNVSGSNQTSLGEAIFYNVALDNETIYKIEGYQAHKWGTQSSLPAAHPYKTNPPVVTWEENIDDGADDKDYIIYYAAAGDTWDSIAFRYYYEEMEQWRLRDANQEYASTLVFEGGEKIKIPPVDPSLLNGINSDALDSTKAPWLAE